MKLAGKYLGAIILFLALLPGIEPMRLLASNGDSCCSAECETPCDTDCEGENCNPFEVCGSCVVAIFEPIFIAKPIQVFSYSLFSVPALVLIERYVQDFWQPPRFV